jgi:hypothetical protein
MTDRFRTCKLVRFSAVTVLTFISVWVDVWSYGRLISYDPFTVVDLRYCRMHVVRRVCGSQSRVAEGRSTTVRVTGSRPFDGSCCLHLDDQAQRSTVWVPNIFRPTVLELASCYPLAVRISMLLLHLWKICVPILKCIVYFVLHRTYCMSNKSGHRTRLSVMLFHNDWSSGGFLGRFSVKCCSIVHKSRVLVPTSLSCCALS